MKRVSNLLMTLATLLLITVSCQKQENYTPNADGKVTFEVSVPSTATKALGDKVDHIDDLVYAVYRTTAETQEDALANMDQAQLLYAVNQGENETQFVNGKTLVTLELLNNQNHIILFWAQVNDTWVKEDADLLHITYPNELQSNNDNYAAFYGSAFIKNVTGTARKSVTLTRPFAQVNVATTLPENYGSKVALENSSVTIQNAGKSFSVATGVSDNVELKFASADVPNEDFQVGDETYKHAAMNYIFANGNVVVTYNIKTVDHGTITNTIKEVPVAENYRTNIIGSLLTSDVKYDITIDQRFDQPDYIINDGWSQTGNYTYEVNESATQTSLQEILAHADAEARKAAVKSEGPVVIINLNGDVYWETGAEIGSTPLLPEDSPISKVDINGNGKSFIATGKGVGPVRLANGGLLTFNDVKIIDLSVSYAENSWEYGYLEMGGELELMDCEVVNAIQLSGNVDVENTTFNSNEDNQYAVWVDGGVARFTSCSFTGARGIKIHEEYGSEVEEVVVTECDFGPLTVKPGIAIGTVNAETTIYIGDSRFINCQAGDQNLYIYETDTDVSTFAFSCEDNEIYDTPNDMLETSLENAAAGETVTIPAGEYTFPASSFKEGVTLQCAEGTVFTGTSALDINGATVEGATFSNPTGNSVGGTINGTFKNCTFDGSNALRYCYADETVVFEDCVFSGDVYGVHFDGGANDVIFRRCIFSGFNTLGGAITLATFEDCTFKANGRSGYNGINLWGSTKMVNTEFTFDGSASTEWIDAIAADKTYEFTDCTINGGSILQGGYLFSRNDDTDITIDGVLYEDFASYTFISTAEQLRAFAAEVSESNTFAGKKVLLAADINLNNEPFTPITNFKGFFDGQGYTISNLNIDANYNYSGFFKSLDGDVVIKNLKFNNAAVKSTHSMVGVLVGSVGGGPTISDIEVTGKVTVDCGGQDAGVIAGYNYGKISKIKIDVTEDSYVKALEHGWCGGVIGYSGEDTPYSQLTSNINVIGNASGVGGIIGFAQRGVSLKNCSSSGDVTLNSPVNGHNNYIRGGGIVGIWADVANTKVILSDCSYTGKLTLSRQDDLEASLLPHGGLVGLSYNTAGVPGLEIDGKLYADAYKTAGLEAAVKNENVTVFLSAGPWNSGTSITHYVLPSQIANNVTIQGVKEAQLDFNLGTCNYVNDLTIEGVTVNWNAGYTSGFGHSSNHLYKDVTFNGAFFCLGQSAKFDGCTFNLNHNDYLWTYGSDVDFEDCVFNCVDGKGVLVYNEGVDVEVSFDGCEFSASKGAKTGNGQDIAAIEISNHVNSPKMNVSIANCTSKGGFAYNDKVWRIKDESYTNNTTGNITITVDGVAVEK